jgi:hypothetical protein
MAETAGRPGAPAISTPPTDRLIADHQSALSREILDIPVAQGNSEAKPNSISDVAVCFQSPAQFRIQTLNRASETVDHGDAK